MKKDSMYALVAILTIVIGLVGYLIGRRYSYNLVWSMIPAVLFFVIGTIIVSRKKGDDSENYTGCNVVNVYQNGCGPTPPGPTPPEPNNNPVNLAEVSKWISSLDSKLTKECQTCIISNAVKLWKEGDLEKVKNMPKDKQQDILKAMLVFDCANQCVIPPSGLDETQVAEWVSGVVANHYLPQCKACVINAILKTWTPADFVKARSKMKIEQSKIIQGVLALNCGDCETNKLDPVDVSNWLGQFLGKNARPDCYDCLGNTILNMWTPQIFAKVKAMSQQSQKQIVNALSEMDCKDHCTVIPSSLTKQAVLNWLSSVLSGEQMACMNCIVDVAVKNWTPALLAQVKTKPKEEQIKIVEAMIAMNCSDNCQTTQRPLALQDISSWLKTILPELDAKCSSCASSSAYNMWKESMPTNQDFHNDVLTKSCDDQIKIARLVADYNCPDVCSISPLASC